MEIIGVNHVCPYQEDLLRYIRKNHSPKKVLLEIHPDDSSIVTGNNGYFSKLEFELGKDAEIIRGDVNYWVGCPIGLALTKKMQKIINKYSEEKEHKTSELIKDTFAGTSMSLIRTPVMVLETFNPYHMYKRDLGIIKTIEETEPDMIITGRLHSYPIKKYFPESRFTEFNVHSPIHYYTSSINPALRLLWGIKPDNVVWVRHEKKQKGVNIN